MSVFVFGSNLAGRHGKGAALHALKHHGAKYGQGEGRQGNSYGIPTKDENIRTLDIQRVTEHVERFLSYAKQHADEMFDVTAIGCGLAGYTPEQIAPLFKDAPSNCNLPAEFRAVLNVKEQDDETDSMGN